MYSLKDKRLAREIISKIKKEDVDLKFMHVCGTHQDTIVKNGLDSLLEECGIKVIQGPGCPVCVTTPNEIEEAILLAKNGKTIASFGDVMNVPGEERSLNSMKAEGCDIRVVYGIDDALNLAKSNPQKDVVFLAIGFETTAPTTAVALSNDPPENFSILCCHRSIPPALNAIVEMGEIKIDGLIEPGHVSTIIGTKPYEFLSREYKIPQVIAGFEPIDVLMACWMLVKQIKKNQAYVQNEYTRVVREEGNEKAIRLINEVFELKDVKWRGFPVIKKSGFKLKKKYEEYDARVKFDEILDDLKGKEFHEPEGCRCGEVLRGLITPFECPLFGQACTPDRPVGPCMVSIEGSCNIEYRYADSR